MGKAVGCYLAQSMVHLSTAGGQCGRSGAAQPAAAARRAYWIKSAADNSTLSHGKREGLHPTPGSVSTGSDPRCEMLSFPMEVNFTCYLASTLNFL